MGANQIEVNPFLYRKDTIDYFQTRQIPIVAFKPLLRGKGVEDPVVISIAKKYSTTPGDVLLRWGAQKGIAVLPKSTNPERMEANLCCFDSNITLTAEDMAALDGLTDPVKSVATFNAHFAERAKVDPASPTIAIGYGPQGQ